MLKKFLLLTVLFLTITACQSEAEPPARSAAVSAGADAISIQPTAVFQTAVFQEIATVEATATVAPTAVPATATPRPTRVPPTTVPPTAVNKGGDIVPSVPENNQFITIRDETGILSASVPSHWGNTRSEIVATDYRVLNLSLWAAEDVDAFPGDYSQPGLYFHANFPTPGKDEFILAELDALVATLPARCESQGRSAFDILNFTGYQEFFRNCTAETNIQVFVGTNVGSKSYLVSMMVPVQDNDDIRALDQIFPSLAVDREQINAFTADLPGNSGED